MKRLSAAVLGITLIASGCASHLLVYDENGNPLKGIPVRSPVLVEVITETIYGIDPKILDTDPKYETYKRLCDPTLNTTTTFMPLGSLSYVGFQPAYLAKSEFKAELSDSGQLKAVTLNSDPASTMESVSTLLGTVLPFITPPKPVPEVKAMVEPTDLQKLRGSVCIVKESRIKSMKERRLDK